MLFQNMSIKKNPEGDSQNKHLFFSEFGFVGYFRAFL